ncbi:MAG TPA: hypothetical protein VGM23_16875 [Armatimonadota bacterium]|jgi:hypothetical protein
MHRYLCIFAIVVALATCALAQPDPNTPATANQQANQGRFNGMMGGGQNNMALEILPRGVFILHNGVLAKFDVETLKAAGNLELFGPLPPQPPMPQQNATDQDREAMRKWATLALPRTAPPATLALDDMLYIVIGTTFFRVNTATLALEAKSDLAAPAAAAPAAGGAPAAGNNFRANQMLGSPALMKLDRGVLYVIIQQELLAVDPKTGNVTTRVQLPKELLQNINIFGGMGGFRNQGGQGGQGGQRNGGRGNRGGQGGQPPQAGNANATNTQQ